MEQAYSCQKWGFVPDIARLDLLYRYGGIYLDTDVELLRPLDELLYQPAFCGVEKWGTVNFGGCSGAQAGNPIIKEILDLSLFSMRMGPSIKPFAGIMKHFLLLNVGWKSI